MTSTRSGARRDQRAVCDWGPTGARWTRTPSSPKQTARPWPGAGSGGVAAGGVNKATRREPQGGPSVTQSGGDGYGRPIAGSSTSRASADRRGRPWSERKSTSGGTKRPAAGSATTFPTSRRRPARAAAGARCDRRRCDRWRRPVHHAVRRQGWLFAPSGLVDGPLPTHYEAQESPVRNALYQQQQAPARVMMPRADNLDAPSAGDPGWRCTVRLHDLPAHRAPHGWRNESMVAPSRGTAAGNVL